jgi:hypothetical protein
MPLPQGTDRMPTNALRVNRSFVPTGVSPLRFFGRMTVEGIRHRHEFRDVQRFCFFVGYPRSGTTLLGTLLNAHPEIVISQEADAVRYLRPGVTRNALFALLLRRDREFASQGRGWNGFDYEVPGLHQGRFDRLRVIGDKKAAMTALRFDDDPARLDRLRAFVRVPLCALHLVRNPFDTIASIARNNDVPLVEAISRYRQFGQVVDRSIARLTERELFQLRYEDFVLDPSRWLNALCESLGVRATQAYLRGCALVVEPTVRRGRDTAAWSDAELAEIADIVASRPVLAGYGFDTD